MYLAQLKSQNCPTLQTVFISDESITVLANPYVAFFLMDPLLHVSLYHTIKNQFTFAFEL